MKHQASILPLALGLAAVAIACSSNTVNNAGTSGTDPAAGGTYSSTGGNPSSGGNTGTVANGGNTSGGTLGSSTGGVANGGNTSGGTSNGNRGGVANGGNTTGGTLAGNTGGLANGGNPSGGTLGSSTGGVANGGKASGGTLGSSTGGVANGGKASGGTSNGNTGGKAIGGAATGGLQSSAGTSSPPGDLCKGTASGTPANTLTVNTDSAQDAISDGIFGLLMERLGKNWSGGLFVGTSSSIPNTDGMRNDVIDAFKEAGVGMIEWPGGCAAGSYNWSSNKNPSNDVGTDRYMKLCGLLGIEPYIVGPGTSAAAANNKAWVEYINNNSAHTDWNLKYFKVGNEVWGCGGNQTETTYEANYLANYDLLSSPVNGKPLKIIAGTDLIGNWPWLDTMLKNIASKIDGIEIHDYLYFPDSYPNVGFTDNQYYDIVSRANTVQIGPRIDQIVTYLDKYDSAKRIKIYLDEWGDWLMNFNSSDDWLQQGTVMDGISAAEQLHLFMQHADRIQMAGLAQGINVIHSLLLTRSSDSALVKTPTFYVFKMFLPHHRSNAKWAPSTLKSENITGNGKTFPVLSSGTSVDDQGRVNVSLANVDLVNTRTIQVTINSSKTSYDVSTAQVITGPAKDSYNDYAQTEKVNIQSLDASQCSISGKTLQVTLPAKSVAMLILTPKS
jgi:alpha-L-arabinofuranosidase